MGSRLEDVFADNVKLSHWLRRFLLPSNRAIDFWSSELHRYMSGLRYAPAVRVNFTQLGPEYVRVKHTHYSICQLLCMHSHTIGWISSALYIFCTYPLVSSLVLLVSQWLHCPVSKQRMCLNFNLFLYCQTFVDSHPNQNAFQSWNCWCPF